MRQNYTIDIINVIISGCEVKLSKLENKNKRFAAVSLFFSLFGGGGGGGGKISISQGITALSKSEDF